MHYNFVSVIPLHLNEHLKKKNINYIHHYNVYTTHIFVIATVPFQLYFSKLKWVPHAVKHYNYDMLTWIK